MTFPEAVVSGLTRFVRWDGRASRSEYWWFVLFNWCLGLVAAVADRVLLGTGVWIAVMVSIAMFLPNLSMLVRRLHDTGRSGWSVWWSLLPVAGPVMLLLWTLTAGHGGPNRFGPAQLGRHGSHGAQRRFQPPPIYSDAAGYRPSDVPRPRRQAHSWQGQDDDSAGAPPMPPFGA